MDAMYWLILLIVLVVIEIITLGLTTIWFAYYFLSSALFAGGSSLNSFDSKGYR